MQYRIIFPIVVFFFHFQKKFWFLLRRCISYRYLTEYEMYFISILNISPGREVWFKKLFIEVTDKKAKRRSYFQGHQEEGSTKKTKWEKLVCLGHCANYANITLKNPSVETICIKTVKKYRFLLPQIPHIRWHFQTFYVDWSLDCLPQQASKLAALKIDDKSNKCFVKTTRWEVIITQLN